MTTADITRTWAGIAAAERIGYNGEQLTPAEIDERERQLGLERQLCAARELLIQMTPEQRDRRLASLRQKYGESAVDRYVAGCRERLRQEGELA